MVPGKHEPIPYARQSISEQDIDAVVAALRADLLTGGPTVSTFEEAVSSLVDARFGVAVSSGTAALHTAVSALGISKGQEVIVPPMTFAATANAVLYAGGTPVFADVDYQTGLLSADNVAPLIGPGTRGVIAVDYAGLPCDLKSLKTLCNQHNLWLLSDAAHSLGARTPAGPPTRFADCVIYSFHPVKHITTAEGGMVVTDDETLAGKMRSFRNHGIDLDAAARRVAGSFAYGMTQLGYNYRLSDLQCALGLSQLSRLNEWLNRRHQVAKQYDEAFAKDSRFDLLSSIEGHQSACHLYVLRLAGHYTSDHRNRLFKQLRDHQIGVNVHYRPVYTHPYYESRFGLQKGRCPNAEKMYERIISLPMFGTISDGEVNTVIETVLQAADEVLG